MATTFLKYFDSIADPRIERYKKHNLLDILLLAISAILPATKAEKILKILVIWNLIGYASTKTLKRVFLDMIQLLGLSAT